jgi:hypothetical protein
MRMHLVATRAETPCPGQAEEKRAWLDKVGGRRPESAFVEPWRLSEDANKGLKRIKEDAQSGHVPYRDGSWPHIRRPRRDVARPIAVSALVSVRPAGHDEDCRRYKMQTGTGA